MPFDSRVFRFFLSLFAVGGVIWLGASIARMVVGFDVFTPGTLVFKTTQSEDVRLHTIWLFTLLGGWTGWSFLVATIGGVGVITMARRSFRTHGWLLMAAILFVLIMPVQGFVAYEDYRLWTLFDRTTGMPLAQPAEIIAAFLHRYTNTAVNIMLGMAMLSALTIILLCTVRPLHRNRTTPINA
jgi:hypothetical protein